MILRWGKIYDFYSHPVLSSVSNARERNDFSKKKATFSLRRRRRLS